MKNKLILFLGMLMVAGAAQAELKNGPYVGVQLGADRMQVKSGTAKENGTSFAWMMALGMRSKALRAELQWANTTRTKIEKAHVEQQRYMLQLYYEMPIHSVIRPYLNAGAGASYTEVSFSGEKSDKTTFAWNAGAGLTLNVSSSMSVDLGYRYIDTGKPKVFGSELQVRHHEGYLGTRFSF